MNEEVEPFLSIALECLAGAQSELVNGRYNNAANRAYYGAYDAAIVALIRAGYSSRKWDHDEVQAAFAGDLVSRQKLYPASLRTVLPTLFTIRIKADYGLRTCTRREASDAVGDADRFVRALLRAES